MNGLRRINLEQAINVRDLGGYPTPDGCTPYGRFIRADNMVGLTEADLETLYQAGVRTVIDLRTPGERERQPGSFENWRDVRVVPCSLLGESLDSFTGFMRSLGENYSEMIVRDRDHYRDLFEIILSENQRGGILFHCTAGKDRTGVTAALLLGLAGCEDADIVADYALTDIYLRPKVKLFLQHNPNADPALFRAPMESMDRFTAFVREEFGSARGYLKSLGFSDKDLDQVWNCLLYTSASDAPPQGGAAAGKPPHRKIPCTRSGMPGIFYLFTAAVPGVTSARRSHGLPL